MYIFDYHITIVTMKITKFSALFHIYLLSFSFLVILRSHSQIAANPANVEYIQRYEEEIHHGIKEQGYKAFYQQLVDEALLTDQHILTKESYYKQLTFLDIMLQLDEGTFESAKNLLNDSYEMYEEKKLGKQEGKIIPPKNYAFAFEEKNAKQLFTVLEVVPTFNECKELANNKSRRKCFIEGVTKNIQQNLPVKEILKIIRKEKLFEKGEDKVRYYSMLVIFKISKDGTVAWAEGNSTHKKINSLVEKTLLKLPQLQPAMYNDEPVNILYTVPITLKES